MTTPTDRSELVADMRLMLAEADAAWKGSPSWHVFMWRAWRNRRKYPAINANDRIITFDWFIT